MDKTASTIHYCYRKCQTENNIVKVGTKIIKPQWPSYYPGLPSPRVANPGQCNFTLNTVYNRNLPSIHCSIATLNLRLVKHVILDTSVLLYCYYAFVLPFPSSVNRCEGLLLNVIFSFSNATCIRWQGLALMRVSCHCVIDVMLLDCVCCTRSIRTRIIVCSVSFHLLLPEFDIPSSTFCIRV